MKDFEKIQSNLPKTIIMLIYVYTYIVYVYTYIYIDCISCIFYVYGEPSYFIIRALQKGES